MLTILGNLLKDILLLVSYIRNSKVFPEPLSSEEEKKYLEKMKEGDEKARNKLIKHNLRLVAHIAKKYDSPHTDNEDLISIGTIGLIKGINTFDSSKNTKLATYAARCVENEILMHLRSTKKLNREMLLQESIGSDKEGNKISLLDIIDAADETIVEKVEKSINKDKLYDKLTDLSSRERKVLEYRYGLKDKERLTQREVADILDISRSYVSRIEKKAINNLSVLFQDKDN